MVSEKMQRGMVFGGLAVALALLVLGMESHMLEASDQTPAVEDRVTLLEQRISDLEALTVVQEQAIHCAIEARVLTLESPRYSDCVEVFNSLRDTTVRN